MAAGPGRYDDLCTQVREKADATLVAIIVVGGNRGHGFSCQTNDPAAAAALPDFLEQMASDIRADLKAAAIGSAFPPCA
jgi:hypothetical protein